MDLLWLIVFLSIIIFIVVLLPFAIYFYEADDGEDDPTGNRQVMEALKMEAATVIAAVVFIIVLFVTVSKSHIPMRALEVNSMSATKGFHAYVDGATLSAEEITVASAIVHQSIKVTLDVSFPVYTIGLTSFVGWFGFSIFCGIGLIALPLDLMLCDRTIRMPMEVSHEC
jgi:LMBR1 domain-containing protein 1